MCFLLLLNGTPLWANPTGGQVTSGAATIANAGTTTTINQSTANAIINWQQFSIASNEATKFFVPNASSMTLNRVLGGNPSAIYGALSSNGKLILINPSGIVVGPGGRIDTAGFIGSTLAISDNDFLKNNGTLHFSGDGTGTIENQGTIHATGGDVYLVAGQVTNGGTISAPQGTAGLAAGTDILFQQAGDQHLYVQSTPLTATRAKGVTNTGTINAAAAELKAAGGNAYALAINNSGQITATGYQKINGQVYLTAEGADITNSGDIIANDANGNGGKIVLNGYGTATKGTVLNSGKLVAKGGKHGTKGGTVEVLGNQVGVTDFGLVDVSGDAGGGTALIGGDEHGANASIPDADQTYLGPNATINADALTLGNGGKVVLWGNETTQAYGAITARGGAQGGNGGSVETSAKTLDAQTSPDLSAPHGSVGTWLLDPSDITISDNATTTPGFSAPFTITSGNTYDISQDDLRDALINADITLDASTGTGTGGGTITWIQPNGESFNPALTTARTLTLNGPGGITFSGVNMNPTGAALSLTLNQNINTAGPVDIESSTLNLNGGQFTANGNGYRSLVDSNGESDGIHLQGATINAQGGSVTLAGNGGYINNQGSLQAGFGILMVGASSITTTGSGGISMTGTFDQNIDSTTGITALSIYGPSQTISTQTGQILLSGTISQGTASGTGQNGASLNGLEVGGGAHVTSTGTSGGVELDGDISGGTSTVTGSNFSFAVGIEVGGADPGTQVSVGNQGTLTLNGKGGSIDASGYNGQDRVFGAGVQLDAAASLTTGTNAVISVTGNFASGATGNGADLTGIDIQEGAQFIAGSGSSFTLTGITAGTTVTSSPTGNNSVGIEIGSFGASPVTLVELNGTGEIHFIGTGGTVDASADNTDEQAGSAGLVIDSGAKVTVNSGGTLVVMATGGSVTTTTANVGVTAGFEISDSGLLTLVGGNTATITGTGGSADDGTNVASNSVDPAETAGVLVASDGAIAVGDGSALTLIGFGGTLDASNASVSTVGDTFPQSGGVEIHGMITAVGSGSINLQGTAGTVTPGATPDGAAFGVDIGDDNNNATVSSQTGDITITGTGGSSPNLGIGVAIHGFNGNITTISTTTGQISITGTGGSGNSGPGSFTGFFEPNYGVGLIDRAEIKTTAGGAIHITGTDGSGDVGGAGVAMTELSVSADIDSSIVKPDINAGTAGSVTINALSNSGIQLAGVTVESHDLQLGTATNSTDPSTITSGQLELVNDTITLTTGNFIAYGKSNSNGPDGIILSGSTIELSGGNISLTGQSAYFASTQDAGVGLTADTSTLSTTGSGNITLVGANGSGSNDVTTMDLQGIELDTMTISTVSGAISITGTIPHGTADEGIYGLEISSSTIEATGNGSISLSGNSSGSTSNDSGNIGIALYHTSVSTLNGSGIVMLGTSGAADMDVNDTAPGGTYGIIVSSGSSLSTTGTAPITLTGTPGNVTDATNGTISIQSEGISFYGFSSGDSQSVTTAAGTISLSGTGGTSDNSSFGVFLNSTAAAPLTISSTSGNVNITGVAGAGNPETTQTTGTYEFNIGVGIADDTHVSAGNTLTINGTGLTPQSGSLAGVGVKIDSFTNYKDGTTQADSSPTTPQLSSPNTILITALTGIVEIDEQDQLGPELSGSFRIGAFGSGLPSLLNNIAGTVTLIDGGNFILSSIDPLTINTGTGGAGSISVFNTDHVILGSITANDITITDSGSDITQSGALSVDTLSILASSSIMLGNTGNQISNLGAITSSGSIQIYTDPGLVVGSPVQGSGTITLESIGNDLTLGPNSSISDPGGVVNLVTDHDFLNNSSAGANAITGASAYHIYAADPTGSDLGGLPVSFTQFSTQFPNGSTAPGSGDYFASAGTNSGSNGGNGNGNNNGGGGNSGGNDLPPALTPQNNNNNNNGQNNNQVAQNTPSNEFSGNGAFSQTDSQSGGLASANGSSGDVGSGDAAQLNNGEMNNVSNPHASGALSDALSAAVHSTLESALGTLGDSVDTSSDDSTTDDGDGQIVGDGGVVEIGDGGVKTIPLSSAPQPLRDALGSGVMQGLQPAGH